MTINVFLADLQNSYFRYIRNSVPIGMGYVAAYLDHIFGDQIRISQLRNFEEVCDALEQATPDVFAFGSYSWNTILTRRTAAFIRERYPDTIIAMGGPDASHVASVCAEDLSANPAIDFIMPNEGEGPTRNLIEAILSASNPADIRQTMVRGCLSVDPGNGGLISSPLERFEEDINNIPSPYLGGHMDRFLDNPNYLPIIQTARGCPYQCTFCVSGKDTWRKIKEFDMDRVKAEIDYVAKHAKNPYMRFADENFGILRRDEEIAEYLMKKRQESVFPAAVSIYTDKHPTERVKRINLIMRDVLPFCISFQTTTEHVLQNIKRINLTDKIINDVTDFARENDLMLVTELIFAMPGETIESFLEAINRLVDYRFTSIAINHLRILKGTQMDLPEDRQKYAVKTMFGMSENGYTHHPEMESIEFDEWVVANNTMSEKEFFDFSRFLFLLTFGLQRGFFRELLFFFETLGIRLTKILTRIIEDPQLCPILYNISDAAYTKRKEMLFPTQQEVEDYIQEKMASPTPNIEGAYRFEEKLMIEMFMGNQLNQAVDEVASIGRLMYVEKNGEPEADFDEQLDVVKQIVNNCFIPLDRSGDEVISISSNYDVGAWATNHYMNPLSQHRVNAPHATELRIHNYTAYQILWENDDTLDQRYKRQLLTINNAGLRRRIIP